MFKSLRLAALLSLCATAAAAQPTFFTSRSGSMGYGNWAFSWNVGNQSEGLELWNVRYKGVSVLYKASMPVVRVKYRGDASSVWAGCGPYADQLSWGNMRSQFGFLGGPKVRLRFFAGMMEIAVWSKIGGYELYQAWYFHLDGRLQPVLYSSGWSCGENPKSRRDHRHHPYWRMDFDIETSGGNVAHEFRKPSWSTTYTATLYGTEQNTFRNSGEDLFWTVGKAGSPRHVVISYWGNEQRDGGGAPWFSFSDKDEGTRRYNGGEDVGWPFGATGHLGFANGEGINQSDIVFWAVGHLSHNWSLWDALNPQWHATGPVIRAVW